MDADYGRNRDHDGAPTKAFEPSLFVWATVMSRPAEDRAIVDAGLRALALDSGPPLVCDESAATYERDRLETRRVFSWSPASLAAVWLYVTSFTAALRRKMDKGSATTGWTT